MNRIFKEGLFFLALTTLSQIIIIYSIDYFPTKYFWLGIFITWLITMFSLDVLSYLRLELDTYSLSSNGYIVVSILIFASIIIIKFFWWEISIITIFLIVLILRGYWTLLQDEEYEELKGYL